MGFMSVPASGGDFKVFVAYNAKAGRWYPAYLEADMERLAEMLSELVEVRDSGAAEALLLLVSRQLCGLPILSSRISEICIANFLTRGRSRQKGQTRKKSGPSNTL